MFSKVQTKEQVTTILVVNIPNAKHTWMQAGYRLAYMSEGGVTGPLGAFEPAD